MFDKLYGVARPFILAALSLTVGLAFAALLSGGKAIAEQQYSVGKVDQEVVVASALQEEKQYPVSTAAERSDAPSVIVCVEEDETCFLPVSWSEAQKLAQEYQEAGVVLCVEGTPQWEAAIDFMGSTDGETKLAWTALQLVRETAAK